MLNRFKYIIQTGIQEWWTNFIDWKILSKSKIHKSEVQDKENSDEGNGTQIHSFYTIPLTGLFISFITFLLIDCNICGWTYQKFKNILTMTQSMCFQKFNGLFTRNTLVSAFEATKPNVRGSAIFKIKPILRIPKL